MKTEQRVHMDIIIQSIMVICNDEGINACGSENTCTDGKHKINSTLLKVVPLREMRKIAAEEINSNLNAIISWGKRWHIEFEPAKTSAVCISLKQDLEDHPSLVMDGIPVKEVETLCVLGFHFDCCLTWTAIIDTMVSRSRQRLGCLGLLGLPTPYNLLTRLLLGR